ncbi:DNA helicase/exodeoxyribonuclease V, beta subunit [Propioniciclava tarda]|nr:DNA helicase/exodeoxyribonuclease V, beta subunit [Propioniciclava tarda]
MMRPFSIVDPLPRGTTVLEASAGTGKTYAIAALATRFLAESRASIGDLLLVTFSRAATAELRSRVRERLVDSTAALARFLADGTPPADDVDHLLTNGSFAEVEARLDRLRAALDRFDQATIMTTHEFCHGMLRGLGVLAPQEPQSRLIDDLLPLADEAASDVYLRRYAFDARRPPFRWQTVKDEEPGARDIARDAVTLDASLSPADADGRVAERVAFAGEVRDVVADRMRQRRLFSFDDQLTRLRRALLDPDLGQRARERLRRRFPVVLVDEFQDTDPVQWQILRSAFGHDDDGALVLIGDPKQAIYAFRGADVHTYSAAANAAATRHTLTKNYRADAAVVDAVSALFAGVLLGDAIDVPPIAAHHDKPRLAAAPGSPWASGVQLRVVESEEPVSPWVAARAISDDLVGVVGTLLGPEAPLAHRGGRPLLASEIAVLVRSNGRGAALAAALTEAGIPATFSGTNSVFASDAAADWVALLAALDQPRRPFVQRAILTNFVGGSVAQLATADDAQWARWSQWLHGWGRIVRQQGVPALWAAIDRDSGMIGRLLSVDLGERFVTDHRHIVELLHHQSLALGRSLPRELLAWLTSSMSEATASSERTRRLETDDAAVHIMTIHRAKGLQFPVVLLPEASRDYLAERDTGAKIVLPSADGRELDVGGLAGPGRDKRWLAQRTDDADESLRALYVGLTRAESHVVAWWANHWDVARSPLHRLVHADHDAAAPRRPAVAYDTRAEPGGGSPFTKPALAASGIAVVAAPETPPVPAGIAAPAAASLRRREWTRQIDQQWRRTSYSGLTAAAHLVDSGIVADEPTEPIAVDADRGLATPSPMAELPGGAAFGTLVHAVYESFDATGDGWRAGLLDEVRRALRRWPIEGVDAVSLADAMAPTLETPLGPLAEHTTLRSFAPPDRLSEFVFEFALDAPEATLADVASLLAAHLPADDVLAAYPARLSGPTLTEQRLHGFLTGSIDAVLRLPGGGHLIVDYKTNRLGAAGVAPSELTLGHYTRPAMAEAMMASHYPLQALLYSVALHRFLARRQKGYDPKRHLAGSAYLFVRGMAGPATPIIDGHPTGVFSWRPSPDLVIAVSQLLAGGRR